MQVVGPRDADQQTIFLPDRPEGDHSAMPIAAAIEGGRERLRCSARVNAVRRGSHDPAASAA
jgi:hypothetical protein